MSTYPSFLLIDSDGERAQRAARLLALLDYRPFVTTNLYQALDRSVRERIAPQALILGSTESQRHPLFAQLVRRLEYEQRRAIPVLLLQSVPSSEPLFYADPAYRSVHTLSLTGLQLLKALWEAVPVLRRPLEKKKQTVVLDVLPERGLSPHISLRRQSRNSHFLQILKAAYSLIGAQRWSNALCDVGLGRYRSVHDWPPDNDVYTIPPEDLSCLHQAVAFSRPDRPVEQLRRWSQLATAVSLQERHLSLLMQQSLKLLPKERVMHLALDAFTRKMNDIRGEDLHTWVQQADGSYLLVHYSNLYAYGRVSMMQQPACHIWLVSLEETLRLVGLDKMWRVSEQECSCQTLTGHCVFVIKRV